LLGEHLDALQLVGAGLILVGIGAATVRRPSPTTNLSGDVGLPAPTSGDAAG
jgi:drug/metabolite transporter (DMT)-like permease